MTPEQLLKPRYKVIADYPGNEWKVGDILDRDWGWDGDDESGFKHHVSHYPHLFKKLEWWEGRSDEDMPEYYKHKDFGWVAESIGVDGTTICFRGRNDPMEWPVRHLLPATEAEYLDYIKKWAD